MHELTILLKKDARSVKNLWRILHRESLFKLLFILLFGVCLIGGLFALFLDGFSFLSRLGGAGFLITRHLFALFFLGIGSMLVLSGVVTSYSTIFRSREVPFLISSPFTTRGLITYKFLESTLLSSWAFFFIIVPFSAAYAWNEKLGLAFFTWTFAFSIPFLFLCAGLGALVTILLLRWFPGGRWVRLAILLVVLGGVVLLTFPQQHGDDGEAATFVLMQIVPGLRVAAHPLVPSHWVARGIELCSQGQPGRGLMLLAVLMSNALLVGVLIQEIGARSFHPAYQRVCGASSTTRRSPLLLLWFERLLPIRRRDVRAMVMKDVRTFLRDPMQWSQALIFFGLLAMYFGSIRSFNYHRLAQEWRNLIAFLNVFSVAAVQCSLSARFVYPQLSLEGHAFWILGLAPIRPDRILKCKFGTAAVCMVTVSSALIFLSTRTLGVDPETRWVALALIVCVSLGVTGLSTGLGAVFLDLKTANPMAIVSGFGGTINLVLCLAFMLATILPFSLIFHLVFSGRLSSYHLQRILPLAVLWLFTITALACIIPLRLGLRSLRHRDY